MTPVVVLSALPKFVEPVTGSKSVGSPGHSARRARERDYPSSTKGSALRAIGDAALPAQLACRVHLSHGAEFATFKVVYPRHFRVEQVGAYRNKVIGGSVQKGGAESGPLQPTMVDEDIVEDTDSKHLRP